MNKELLRLNLPGAAAFVSAPVCCVCFSRALRAALLGAARGVAYPLTTFRLWLLRLGGYGVPPKVARIAHTRVP